MQPCLWMCTMGKTVWKLAGQIICFFDHFQLDFNLKISTATKTRASLEIGVPVSIVF
jgi:hypothetical protein